jgi:hypothetical protein
VHVLLPGFREKWEQRNSQSVRICVDVGDTCRAMQEELAKRNRSGNTAGQRVSFIRIFYLEPFQGLRVPFKGGVS